MQFIPSDRAQLICNFFNCSSLTVCVVRYNYYDYDWTKYLLFSDNNIYLHSNTNYYRKYWMSVQALFRLLLKGHSHSQKDKTYTKVVENRAVRLVRQNAHTHTKICRNKHYFSHWSKQCNWFIVPCDDVFTQRISNIFEQFSFI